MNCPICGASSRNRFCSAHERAYENLQAAYEVWHRALEISWWEYLERVERNENSGRWVQEVCAFLLRNRIMDGEGLKLKIVQSIEDQRFVQTP